MDNATAPVPNQATQDDNTTTSGDSNALLDIIVAVVVVALVLGCAVASVYYHRRGTSTYPSTTSTTREKSEKEDTELGEGLGPVEPVTTHSSEDQAPATTRESRVLDVEGTWRRAKFLFPGLLNDPYISLRCVIGKRITSRKYSPCPNPIVAIQVELKERLEAKIFALSRTAGDWEDLNKKENASNLCIAVGMNEAAVRLRFKLIENLEKEFPFLTRKTSILHSIRHVIDTIHVFNRFGELQDIDDQIRRRGYQETEWLSYLGVKWKKSQITDMVREVENTIQNYVSSRHGFFVHGTVGCDLEKLLKVDDGELQLSGTTGTLTHDFGPGFYCFKDDIPKALSFAINRCWPIAEDPVTGDAVVGRCNPALILFPDHDHTIICSKNKTLEVRGKPMNAKLLEAVKDGMEDKIFAAFVECRKKWKNDRRLGFWKDLVKLSLIHNFMPQPLTGYHVFYGPMHSAIEEHKPTGDKTPVVDKDEWTQYCFRNTKSLGEERMFVEFDIDWTNLYWT